MLRRTLVSIASLTSLSVVLALAALGCGGTVSSEPPATAGANALIFR